MSFERWKQRYVPCRPGEKIRIAIIYQVASFWPSIESFYEECMKDEDTDIRIFFVGAVSVEKAQIQGSDTFLLEKGLPFSNYSEEAIQSFLPHVVFYQTPYDVSFRNPDSLAVHLRGMGIRIAYIPYGIEIADTEDARWYHFHTFVIRNAWRIYTFSERMKADYRRYCPNRHAVRAFGVPKLDSVARKKQVNKEKIRAAAGGRKIILWKLHSPKLIFEGTAKRQVSPDLREYRKFAEMVEQYKWAYFVVMPHPMFFSETINPYLAAEGQKLLDQLAGKKNVFIDRAPDYRTSLYSADAIIIDRSALMVEAGFLDVPVLYMKNSDYEEPLTQAVKPLVDSYEQGTTCEDMCRFLEKLDTSGGKIAERITAVRKAVFPYEMGRCGRLILEDLKKSVLRKPPEAIRLAFFGASFICEHYINELKIRNNPDFEIICLSDNDQKKWGTQRAGIDVVPPEELKERELDLIVISSENYYMPIKKQLVYELFLEEKKILPLDWFAEEYISAYR